MFGIAHVLNRIHDVFERFLHFSEFVFNRGDACSSIVTAFFQRLRDVLRQWTQVLDGQHMRQQIFDHSLVEGFGADSLCLTRLTARVLRGRADEEGVTAALALLAGDALDVHRMFFAFHMSADHQPGEQILAPDPARLMVAIHLPAIMLFGVLRLALLFSFKPLMRDQRRNEFLVQLAAVDDVAGVNAVGEECIIAVDVLEQARGLVNLAVARALMPHLPREIAALPHLRVRHEALDDTRLAGFSPLLALVHTDLNPFAFEAGRHTSGTDAQIAAGAFPVGIVSEEFRVVIPRTDELRQPTFGVLRDFFEVLFILPLLKGFNERINGGVARIGGGHQVNDGDGTQPQVGLDVGRFDAVASEPVGLPEDHTEGILAAGFFALVAVIDVFEAAAQVGEQFL